MADEVSLDWVVDVVKDGGEEFRVCMRQVMLVAGGIGGFGGVRTTWVAFNRLKDDFEGVAAKLVKEVAVLTSRQGWPKERGEDELQVAARIGEILARYGNIL